MVTSENIYVVKRLNVPMTSKAWDQATKLNSFSSPWLSKSSGKLVFVSLYDSRYLYFKFNVDDSPPISYVKTNDKLEVIKSDRVEMFFSCDRHLSNYYCLEMDSVNRVLDYKASFYRKFDYEWEWPKGALHVKSQLKTQGYSVEGRISLKSLKELGLIDGTDMYVGLYRGKCLELRDDHTEVMQWISWVDPKVTDPDFHVPSSFGVFRLI